MFGIDGIEFLVIILVAVIVIGPKDMPKMLRAFAQATARIRALAQEFRGHFDEAMRHAGMQDTMDRLKDVGDTVRNMGPRRKLREFYTSLEKKTGLEKEQQPEAEKFADVPDFSENRGDETYSTGIPGGLTEESRAEIKPAEPVGDFAVSGTICGSFKSIENLNKAAACAVEGNSSFACYPLGKRHRTTEIAEIKSGSVGTGRNAAVKNTANIAADGADQGSENI